MQIFRFPSFRLCPFYPTGINIGSKRPQHVLKHAEKQEETRRVQSFGAKFGANGTRFFLANLRLNKLSQTLEVKSIEKSLCFLLPVGFDETSECKQMLTD